MRILGITIPNEKRLDIGLTSLFGVGSATAIKVLNEVKVLPETKSKDLSLDQESAIRKLIEEMTIEGNLKREVAGNVKRLKDIKCYRGVRHMRRLPVNGQRTKTNSRTVRGNVRNTMASGRRKESKT
jgi:small subunit ribosomal protein S13